jgi:hypothetical protein
MGVEPAKLLARLNERTENRDKAISRRPHAPAQPELPSDSALA